MQTIRTLLLLSGIMLISGSFKGYDDDLQNHYKNNGYFFAILDGNMFEMRDDDKYRAELVNKTGSLNQKASAQLSRVANSLIFYGNNYKDENGKPFDENIEFEYSFANGELGEPEDLKIEVKYDQHSYYQIPELTRFRISKIDWSEDRRNLLMNADFDCKMRRWGFPAESQPTIRVKGRMVGINVSVPAWVKIKEPNQLAGN